jgi:hypothetical protein
MEITLVNLDTEEEENEEEKFVYQPTSEVGNTQRAETGGNDQTKGNYRLCFSNNKSIKICTEKLLQGFEYR